MNKRKVGSSYEQVAAAYLMKQGYKIIEMNYYAPRGEVDIIAYDGEYLVFAEVKYRKNQDLGWPEEAVHRAKQKKISMAARYYMWEKKYSADVSCRFDVITIMNDQVHLIKDAFYL